MPKTALKIFLAFAVVIAFSFLSAFSIKAADNGAGQLSFGDILSGNIIAPTGNTLNSKKTDIKALLDKIDNISQKSPANKVNLNTNTNFANYKNAGLPLPIIPTPTNTMIEDISFRLSKVKANLPTILPNNINPLGDIEINPIRTTYSLIVLGDSMVDTLGRDLPDLKKLMSSNFPRYSFAILNYGFGATDLESGLKRLTHGTKYLSKYYPPLLSFQPDILVVESFAYNHWTGEKSDLDRQWLTYSKIIDTVREKSPGTKILFAATIAPNALKYGDGVLNWGKDLKWQSAQITRAYLQNMIGFANSQNIPVADAYTPSLDKEGNGLLEFISSYDNLHPSKEGAVFFSQKIVEAMKSNNLIQ